jgi:hypothetical protein
MIDMRFFVYNYKEDKIIHETPEGSTVWLVRAMNDRYTLTYHCSFDGQKKIFNALFYDWRTGETVENDLTNTLNRYINNPSIDPCRNIHLGKRYLFGDIRTTWESSIITWDEDYSNVKITPLGYLTPKGKGFSDFILSADGLWATTFVCGYRGLYDEDLSKRAFFHLDDRYPNGISPPVITNDYEEHQWEYSAFVEHPVHGLCFAQEWRRNGRLYLRLYKMSDVLAEINRRQ